MKQKAAAGKTPASKPAVAKPSTLGPAGRKPSASGAVAPAQKTQGMDAAAIHNRELQLNQNNDRYWRARGHEVRPEHWETASQDPGTKGS